MAPTEDRWTILVVDDEPDVRNSTALVLETLDYTVVEAGDGLAALALLERDASIDLLLSDVVLSGEMNGNDLAERACAERPSLKVVLTSGRPEFLEGLPFAVIAKPFRMAELGRKIAEVLGVEAEDDL
jgi:CheY-like chemotaxis protein